MKKITPGSTRPRSTLRSKPEPARTLETLRSEIDQIDATLVDSLMRRSRVVLRVATLKSRHALGGVDVPREQAIFAKVERRRVRGRPSAVRGYSREALERIYRVILEESRALLGARKK